MVPVTDRGSASRPAVAPVLGATPLALLQSLARRRTTTDLAALHHLTPGSVSYHLSRLLAADLIRRGTARTARVLPAHRTRPDPAPFLSATSKEEADRSDAIDAFGLTASGVGDQHLVAGCGGRGQKCVVRR